MVPGGGAMLTPLPCPFCGHDPAVFPKDPQKSGDCWGAVQCVNPSCAAGPSARDDEPVNDDRGSDAYKQAAIARWNRRA